MPVWTKKSIKSNQGKNKFFFCFVPVFQTFEKQRRGSGQVETGV